MDVFSKIEFFQPNKSKKYAQKHAYCSCGNRRQWGVSLCKECSDERHLDLKVIVVEHRTGATTSIEELRDVALAEARKTEQVRQLRIRGLEITEKDLEQLALVAYGEGV